MNPLPGNPIRRTLAILLAALLPWTPVQGADGETATFTVDVKLGETPMELLRVTLNCFEDGNRSLSARIPPGDSRSFSIPVPRDQQLNCLLGALPIAGQRLQFRGDGGSDVALTEDGCLFSSVEAGHSNFCQITIEQERTSLTVYKKWIGSAGREADVEIQLHCDAAPFFEPRHINQDQPGGWDLRIGDPDGIECDVFEVERADFRADTSDCRDLVIRPGAQEECTMVNTKVVKMIQMLNRYGLAIMILVFLVAGMIAARRSMP